MIIKKFNEMYQDDDTLGTIRDIIESNILDEYDVELFEFGRFNEKKFGIPETKEYDPTYSYTFSADLLDGEGCVVAMDDDYELLKSTDFIYLALECESVQILENLNIIKSIEGSVKMIKSILNLNLIDLSDRTCRNSISDENWESVFVNWESPNLQKIVKFLKKKQGEVIKIQIFLK